VLLLANMTVLLLPLLGIVFFRFYENALVRGTEDELISQAAVISAVFKAGIRDRLEPGAEYGIAADPESPGRVDEYYTPVFPQIDLSAMEVLPPRPDGVAGMPPDPVAAEVGAGLGPVLEDAQRTTLSGVRILDFNGVAVGGGGEETGLDFSGVPEVARALRGSYAGVIRERISDSPTPPLASISRGTGIRAFAAFPVIENGRVWGVAYLSRTPPNILNSLYAEKEKLVLAGLVLLGMTLLIALLTSHLIARPIYRLIKKTREFSEGDRQALRDIDLSGVQEVGMLAGSFSDMAVSLHDRSEYIRNFAMHVSHEFKTPITSIQGAAELLLDHLDDMAEEEKRKFLSNIVTDSERLRRLVSRLLELAKSDNAEVSGEGCGLAEAVSALRGRYADLGLGVTLRAEGGETLPMAREHFEAVLTNLFDNALQHGASEVAVEAAGEGGGLRFRVADNGSGISRGNRDKIFEPFFTTRRQAGGTGLGLGIVRSLLAAHGGDIRVLDGRQGAVFEISFPHG
jgi:signal transduction histidine kinase